MVICDVQYVCRASSWFQRWYLWVALDSALSALRCTAKLSSCCEITAPFLGQRCLCALCFLALLSGSFWVLCIRLLCVFNLSSYSVSECILVNSTNKSNEQQGAYSKLFNYAGFMLTNAQVCSQEQGKLLNESQAVIRTWPMDCSIKTQQRKSLKEQTVNFQESIYHRGLTVGVFFSSLQGLPEEEISLW